jgi:hypothetical protein
MKRIVLAASLVIVLCAILFAWLGGDRVETNDSPAHGQAFAQLPPREPSALPHPPSAPSPAKNATEKRIAHGEPAIRGSWGGALGQFGRRREEESNPEAPMAIIADKGDLLVLDQANQRVERFHDGRAIGAFPASETVQDMATAPGGKTVLLDRLADKRVQVYGPDGKLENEAPIVGRGLTEGGKATGVFADDRGIYVEREHGTTVRIADSSGNTDAERPELPGRPTRDGRFVVTAVITNQALGALVVTAFDRMSLHVAWSRPITLATPILQLVMLDSDANGNVYVAADTGRESPQPPFSLLDESITVVRISSSGAATGTLDLPAPTGGDEMQHPITVDDQGAIYQMMPQDDGLTVMRYTWAS